MRPGIKVTVQVDPLYARHSGIRFDARQVAANISLPKGASGQVLRVSDNGSECLVELYWNDLPRAAPLAGHTWIIWVKREWFGQLFATSD